MSKHLKTQDELVQLLATSSLPRPGDFPLGSLKSRAAVRTILQTLEDTSLQEANLYLSHLSPMEAAMIEDIDNPRVKKLTVQYIRVGQETAAAYGIPFSTFTPEQIRYRRKVMKIIDETTGGRATEISLRSAAAWRQQRDIAMEKLKRQGVLPPHNDLSFLRF